LLGRSPINLDTPELQRFLAGKRVLVTGAGGSIGSEICRQTMRFCPQRLVLLERAENSLFEIDRELRHNWVGADVRPWIGDVTDAARVQQVFEAERPQVVFHCAAHKHVPMMEAHPCEAIKNNIFGTKVVADTAAASRVAAFVLVSTDKAVNPTSVMGATKRFAELYVQTLNEGGGQEDAETRRRGDAEKGEEDAETRRHGDAENGNDDTGTRRRGDAEKGNDDTGTRRHGDAEKGKLSLSASPRPCVSVSSSPLPASPRHRVPASPRPCT
jgi:hypothetical protein